MLFTATCPHCSAKFKASDEYVGKKGKCQKCGETFIIEEPVVVSRRKVDLDDDPEPKTGELEDDLGSLADAISSSPGMTSSVKPLVSPSFGVLRMLISLYVVLAAISILAGVVVAMYLWIRKDDFPSAALMFAAGVFTALPLLLVSELIQLALQIDKNTNFAANKLEEIRSILAGRL